MGFVDGVLPSGEVTGHLPGLAESWVERTRNERSLDRTRDSSGMLFTQAMEAEWTSSSGTAQ